MSLSLIIYPLNLAIAYTHMEARICKWVVILVYVHYINVYFSDFLFYIYIDIHKIYIS